MLRKLCGAFLAVAIFTGILLADEATGKFKKWEKGEVKGTSTLSLTVKDKDTDYTLTKETKILNGDEEVKGKDRRTMWKDLKEGTEVTVVYDKDGDKITVKEVKVKK